MKIKWQWFIGGQKMFWVIVTIICIMISVLLVTYVINPMALIYTKEQNVNHSSIQEYMNSYIESLDINIDKPIECKFVEFKQNTNEIGEVILGTFYEWNDTYFINITIGLYDNIRLESIVKHETRHMIVSYLKSTGVIDLEKYSEEIAEGINDDYNNLFNDSINLLKLKQGKGE